MKTILASTYALNPYKGSEDGMGWNFILQIAKRNKVIAITRENNKKNIDKYMAENPSSEYDKISFLYYDLPYILRFWKGKGKSAMMYYFVWQLFLPIFIVIKKVRFDISHNVNFHNDWTFSLLWILKKPMVWGPVGHHPKIPKQYILPVYGLKAYLQDRAIWLMKQLFWNVEPLLWLTKKNANHIFCMNSSSQQVLNLKRQFSILPSVASEKRNSVNEKATTFKVLSIGRFVPLKGFDVTISSFAKFYHALSSQDQQRCELTIVGKGPEEKRLRKMIKELKIEKATTMITWVERSALTKIYNESDVFLFPSHEGAGMVVSEALSYGLPVLCFDNCGPGEFIDEECGIKVKYTSYDESVQAFSQHLEVLYKKDLQKMNDAAIKRHHSYFDWDLRSVQLDAVYQKLITIA